MVAGLLGWTGCSSPLQITSSNPIRHVVILTFNRHGSSLVTARIAEAFHGAALPLFEMFNSWPFAMLNFYSSEIFTRVKMTYAEHLVAPELYAHCVNPQSRCHSIDVLELHKQLISRNTGKVMKALRNVSTTPFALGKLIRANWSRTLRIADDIAVNTSHRWLVFKLMEPEELGSPTGLVAHLAAHPRTVVVRLRRNFFHAYVSQLKILTPGCGSGHSASEMHGRTACKPNVSLAHLAKMYQARVRESAAYLRALGGALPQAAPWAWQAMEQRAALIHLWYEEIEHMKPDELFPLLRQRLEAAVGNVASLSCPGEAIRSVHNLTDSYVRQDAAASLRGKISNYEELAKYFAAARTGLCMATGVATCQTDPEFNLPA
uniref:Uncharacterized protein n=1 Tax=Coccolithus braarudii TaxID=221442 RepID=A0A7S0PZT6_9EUKA|mmetsp:Transcript_18668/g.40244  ORF Transcript_18668/g.40244 Transcript_18668/m.40244 type:complete len:376 (+) Transcript_18668:103-1230(+)